MTHDELLARLESEDILIDFQEFTERNDALIAVVKLHSIYGYVGSPDLCNECSIAGKEVPFPCNTIRAIERELK